MPQVPLIQTAAPTAPHQAKPSGSTGSKEQSRFSSQLNKTLSGKQTDRQADQEKIAREESGKTDEKPQAEGIEETGKPQKTKKSVKDSDAITADSSIDNPEQPISTSFCTESSPGKSPETTTVHYATKADKTAALSATIREGKTATSPLEIVEPAALTKPQAAKAQDTLISQLQKIINSSSEKETVSIKRADKSSATGSKVNDLPAPPFTTPGQPGTKAAAQAETNSAGGLSAATADDMEKVAGKQADYLAGTRHGIHQQLVDAKTGRQNPAEDKQSFQENRQEDKLAQQTASSSPSSGLSSATDQAGTFSQIVTTSQPAAVQAVTVETTPTTLPSGTVVHEDEIIRQMTEKFQVSGKHTDSRINIKLHPAELGQLKIDLSVKEGSIRANIVAQSHHTMQILEKNIQKLRAVLENQGFTVDQIAVSAESDSVAGFDLFDSQFFGGNDQPPTPPQGRRTEKTAFALEEGFHPAWTTSSGVNVKI